MSGRGRGAQGHGRGGRGSRGASRGRGGARGRGRGGSRGGRGGGRGGGGRGCGGVRGRGSSRGRGRGAQSNWSAGNQTEDWNVESQTRDESLDITKDLRKFFVGTASFDQHYDAQEAKRARYAAGMSVLEQNGVELSQNARVRALAAAWTRKDHDLANSFLVNRESFGLVEVLKALTLLDSSRRIREEEKKLKKLHIQTGGKVKPQVLGKFKSNIDNLQAVRPKVGSASGAVCKHIRRWVRKFTKEELEFYALHFPTEPWKRLADICHFHPTNDFVELPWFLPFCFGSPAPEGSMVHSCRDAKADNVNDLLREFPIPYSHIKQHQSHLTEESKGRIAAKDKLEQIIWYYEELACSEVDEIIKYRLRKGDKLSLPYGKLMERLLTIKMIREEIPRRSYYGTRDVERNKNPTKADFFNDLVPLAQQRLHQIKLSLDTPVVVIGDRSSSMEVAIRTSTIIASLLTALCGAKLVFFDHENTDAPFIPSNIEEVLEMAVTIQTRGSTAPAASLYPFYATRKVFKTFIIVTDEEENGSFKEYRFAPLFKKYRAEVSPQCKLVFVSFLRNQHATGQMVNNLQQIGITDNIMQFKFDQSRPDLTKLDKLFGLLSAETEDFESQVKKVEKTIMNDGLENLSEKIKALIDPSSAEDKEVKNKVAPSSYAGAVASHAQAACKDVTVPVTSMDLDSTASVGEGSDKKEQEAPQEAPQEAGATDDDGALQNTNNDTSNQSDWQVVNWNTNDWNASAAEDWS